MIMGGAFIGLLIGSGFTTGQEIMQYFVSYGNMGYIAILLMFILFCYVGASLVSVGYEQKFKEPKNIYKYYCGKYIGTFFDYFSVIFLFMSFWVMVAGAGAVFNQSFGIPNWMGGAIMGAITILTLFLGFNKLVDIIGSIGPVVSILAILLGIAGIGMHPEGLSTFSQEVPGLVESGKILQAGDNWFMACISYVGFCMMWLAVFMTNMGTTAHSRKEGIAGAVFGSSLFSLAVLLLMFGLSANLVDVAGAQIPSLVLATKVAPALATIYTVIVFIEIYTTAGPLLWTPVKRVAPDEKSNKYRMAILVLGVIGIVVGLKVPFDKLINVIYVINGYVGFLLFFMMVITDVRTRILKNYTPKIVLDLKNQKDN
ncbi:hypothetical protein E9840_04005 [Tissierella creatinini]|nr:hypothetical protein E9840_04005 [Tissierella creatinini]TJX67419.1 hypothetical protein E8P77_05295 [Soehngenia saccharolytica]